MKTSKTLFLIASFLPWALVGGALIYLSPQFANNILHSTTTETWLKTLGRSGYNPTLATAVCGAMIVVGTIFAIVGKRYFSNDRPTAE
jgi:hypothetical protein